MYLGATDPKVIARQKVEILIIKAVVRALLDKKFTLSVYDGGDHLLALPTGGGSGVTHNILDALYNTDEDYLNVWKDNVHVGWVRFIYGNDGWDVINDYTTNLEAYIGEGSEVGAIINKLEKGHYDIELT